MNRTLAFSRVLAALVLIMLDVVIRLVRRGALRPQDERGIAPQTAPGWLRVLRTFVNVVGFACFATVAGSGLVALLARPGTLTGYPLLVHVAAAAAFTLASVAAAIFWTDRNRFHASDWNRPRLPVVARKIFFWLALATAVPTLISIICAMSSWVTPSQQQSLFRIHQSCAVTLAAAGFLFAWFALVSWRSHLPD